MPQDPATLPPLLDAVKLRRRNGGDAILTGGPEAIIAVNSDDHITALNPAAEKLFGRRAADTIGRPVTDLISDGLPRHDDDNRSGPLEGLGKRPGELSLNSRETDPG